GLLDLAGLAQPNRADDESRPHVARPPRTAPELVPGQRRGLQWRCRGLEQQDSSGDQKVLWLSDLRCYGNSHVSHARPTARAGINPQILLTRRKWLPLSRASERRPVPKASPCNGSATMCATTCIGLEQCRRNHSAPFAGKPAPA